MAVTPGGFHDGLRKNVRRRADGRWYWHSDPAFMRIDPSAT